MSDLTELEKNYAEISSCAERYGARLLAATKTVPVETVNYAINTLGLSLIGENRVQELLSKYDFLEKTEIHMIGSLQSNKCKYIVDKVSLIHSLDSEKLARELEKQCSRLGVRVGALIEINIANEESKGGITAQDLFEFYDKIKDLEHVRVRGIMTMAPAGAGDGGYRRYFTEARKIYENFTKNCIPKEKDPVLSMGMSDSYRVALECGSNMIRVGSALFGKRNYK